MADTRQKKSGAELAPVIANVQRFSLGDGPGIRTTVFFKGCNLHCPWCHNPETISPSPTLLTYESAEITEVCGKRIPISELIKEIMEDADYYAESGGGVTFSGGEVLLQADAAAALAAAVKREGMHLIVDTAGNVPYAAFAKLNPYTDVYYFDYKSADAGLLREHTGGDLERITKNLQRLLGEGKRVRVRIPLIPAFNTDLCEMEKIAAALLSLGITHVDLLPFHPLGKSKYTAMGKPYAYAHTPRLTEEELSRAEEFFKRYFTVKTEKH